MAKKISLLLLVVFLCLTLLESGLRFSAFIALQIREHRNNRSLKAKKECVILCLRDSINAWSKEAPWPVQLERILNEKNTGVRFRVVDKGLDAAPSSALLYSLDKSISQYKPDMVIAMMGSYDGDSLIPFKDAFSSKIKSFFLGLKLYDLSEFLLRRKGRITISKTKEELKGAKVSSAALEAKDNVLSQAETQIKKEIEADPGNYQLYASLGHFYNTQGKYQLAEEAFKKSLEINPDNDSPYNGLGDGYYARDKFEQAEEMFKKVLEISPNNENVFFCLINTYKKLGKYEQVEEMFKKAIERDPGNASRYLQLGSFYNTQAKYQLAEEAFKKSLEINPDNNNAYDGLGKLYNSLGNYEQAEEMFKKLTYGDVKRYFSLGSFYNAEARYEEAEHELKRAIDVAPYNYEAFVVLGDTYRNQGKYHEADEALNKAIETSPNDATAYVYLGQVYKEIGRYQEAEQMFNKAIEFNPGSEKAYVGLGRCYIEQKKYKEAVEILEKGIALSPINDLIYVTLASCYSEKKLQDELHQEKLLKDAIKANSRCDSAYLELGRLCSRQGRYKDAEELLKEAIELNPKSLTASTLELGYCYIREGKTEQLNGMLNKISETKTKDDRLYAFLAVNYQARGDSGSASRYFQEADRIRLTYYCPQTLYNYQKFKDVLKDQKIRLVCVQYPMHSLKSLKKIIGSTEGVIFVDNKKVFQDALRQSKYEDYFQGYCAGDFGSFTPKSEELLARNIAEVILRQIF